MQLYVAIRCNLVIVLFSFNSNLFNNTVDHPVVLQELLSVYYPTKSAHVVSVEATGSGDVLIKYFLGLQPGLELIFIAPTEVDNYSVYKQNKN